MSSRSEMSLAQSEDVSGDAVVMCRHGLRASIYTSWTLRNPGRRFSRCGYREGNDCNFFQWYDPSSHGLEKEILTYLLRQRNTFKEKVKGLEELNNTIIERLALMKEKCERLESLSTELKNKVEVLSKSEKMYESYLKINVKNDSGIGLFMLA
ncbi:uncharacterized protein LOC131172185 [Hevea brasiliensis]|uniref:uncharacterized protein LOC131172185 n=1 Tax=Hevea brasiliensis TaxID=3981 RepID=UPI0025F7E77A|nr:uncharacterized protein LOC131172185 [Hevea brasiliensis]